MDLLHGRLSSDEKDEVMQSFRKNEAQVSRRDKRSWEVGVDVPKRQP